MIKNLFRKQVAMFEPYVPGKPIEEVKRELGLYEIEKLASNENQLGPSPKAIEAIIKAATEVNFYPEATAIDLKRKLAQRLGITAENLVIGNGGEELLQIIAQTFIDEGDEVIVAEPSFGIYNTTVGFLGGTVKGVPLKEKRYDLDGMLIKVTDKTKLIYLCSPNNPTGHIVTKVELDDFLDKVPENVVVILDEAYYEFAVFSEDYPNTIPMLARYPNIVILRTFSKCYGIAGLRIGYVISSAEIAGAMNKIKLTFDVNRIAQAAALSALDDEAFLKKTISLNRNSIELIESYCQERGFDYFKSYANFVWLKTEFHSKTVFDELMKRGVIMRPGFFWGWDNWFRVSTGTIEQTKFFIEKMDEISQTVNTYD